MPAIEDHDYLKTCAQLATCLSISIASARGKVEIVAAREGKRDIASKKSIAEKLLKKALLQKSESKKTITASFDELLAALAEDENFMIED